MIKSYNITGDKMEYFSLIFKTLFFYFFIVLAYRIMGKREVGELSIIDLIVSVLIAELVAISLENEKNSVLVAIIPISLLVLCQISVAFLSLKEKRVRKLFEGEPSFIINDGKLKIKEMIKQRYSIDDLLQQLREKEIRSIKEVEYAILETSGKLSVFKKDEKEKTFPLPLIIEGKIDEKALQQLNKSKTWLESEISEPLDNIFYGFYKNNKIYIIKKNELEH